LTFPTSRHTLPIIFFNLNKDTMKSMSEVPENHQSEAMTQFIRHRDREPVKPSTGNLPPLKQRLRNLNRRKAL
jgi:hypothetical protein